MAAPSYYHLGNVKASKTIVEVTYDGVNISTDISKYLLDFVYTDNVHGKADESTKTSTTENPPTDFEQTQLGKLAALFLQYSNEPNNLFFYNAMSALQNELLKIINLLEGKGYADQALDLREGVGEHLRDKS